MTPQRIQLTRRKTFFNLQERSRALNGLPAVNCARPSKWGNPYTLELAAKLHPGEPDNILRARCVAAFRAYASDLVPQIQAELRGKNLACWCKPEELCHADVLLELANAGAVPQRSSDEGTSYVCTMHSSGCLPMVCAQYSFDGRCANTGGDCKFRKLANRQRKKQGQGAAPATGPGPAQGAAPGTGPEDR